MMNTCRSLSLAGLLSIRAATLFILALASTGPLPSAFAATTEAGTAPALLARHQALHDALTSNAFQRPLVLESTESSDEVKGDIYAVVARPFVAVSSALATAEGWCEILILHHNTKLCNVSHATPATTLMMNVGKKYSQPLEESFRLAFAWQLMERKDDYLRVSMAADSGPVSTRDYRITLEAMPLENNQTFLHLSYSYGFGFAGKLAMQVYFGTVGRTKVGFTVTGKSAGGQPTYVEGMRGLVERNTMRYYLAIESFLAAPTRAQFEKRLNDWFNASEQYPRQLHEMDKPEYLEMKRFEYHRQNLGDKDVVVVAPGTG